MTIDQLSKPLVLPNEFVPQGNNSTHEQIEGEPNFSAIFQHYKKPAGEIDVISADKHSAEAASSAGSPELYPLTNPTVVALSASAKAYSPIESFDSDEHVQPHPSEDTEGPRPLRSFEDVNFLTGPLRFHDTATYQNIPAEDFGKPSKPPPADTIDISHKSVGALGKILPDSGQATLPVMADQHDISTRNPVTLSGHTKARLPFVSSNVSSPQANSSGFNYGPISNLAVTSVNTTFEVSGNHSLSTTRSAPKSGKQTAFNRLPSLLSAPVKLFLDSGKTTPLKVTLLPSGESYKVVVHAPTLNDIERNRIKARIEDLLSAHGLHTRDIDFRETAPTHKLRGE